MHVCACRLVSNQLQQLDLCALKAISRGRLPVLLYITANRNNVEPLESFKGKNTMGEK